MSETRPTAPKPGELFTLPRIEAFSNALRSMFVNIAFFAGMLLLIPAVAGQFTGGSVVIERIAVPKALAEQGYTGEVVANRLWDGLNSFARDASAARDTIVAIPDSQLVQFSLPDAAISVDSIFAQIRQFLNIRETRIGGEFLCADPDCTPSGVRLRLRVVHGTSEIVDLPEIGTTPEADYYREAAAGIFGVIDPYVAIAAQAETEPLRAAMLARALILDGGSDAKWAHNLVGDIERRRGRPEAAAIEYHAALAIDPALHAARGSLALALAATGQAAEAEAELAEIERQSPGHVLAASNRAVIALGAGDREAAVAHLREAARREPLEPGHLVGAGDIELQLGRADAAIALFDEALAIDPGHGAALNAKAMLHVAAGRPDDAIAVFQRLLEYEPDSATAYMSMAGIELERKAYARALALYDQALALDQGLELAITMRAVTLEALGQRGEAIAALSAQHERHPADIMAARFLAAFAQRDGKRDLALGTLRATYAATASVSDRDTLRAEIERLEAAR